MKGIIIPFAGNARRVYMDFDRFQIPLIVRIGGGEAYVNGKMGQLLGMEDIGCARVIIGGVVDIGLFPQGKALSAVTRKVIRPRAETELAPADPQIDTASRFSAGTVASDDLHINFCDD